MAINPEEIQCWKCGAPLAETPLPLSRYARCRGCGADLYVCRLCTHYDARWNNACREERAEAPMNKEGANFCDWFSIKAGAYQVTGNKERDSRGALDELFGGVAPDSTTGDDALSALDALFKSDTPGNG
jgi:hypothetical protein